MTNYLKARTMELPAANQTSITWNPMPSPH
jgi:hypothetical protein